MRFLLDTNILARYSQATHPLHAPTLSTLKRLREQNHDLCIVPQVVYEYWAIATRPAENNGLSFSTDETNE